jgi:hypothetical protein
MGAKVAAIAPEVPLSTLTRRTAPLLALAALAGAGLACSSSTDSASTTTTPTTEAASPTTTVASGGAKGIAVTMKEWTVEPATSTAAPGKVTFDVKNAGEKTHELVLFKTDLAADKLPLDEDGAVDEAGAGIELIEEVEDVGVGETKSFSADVTAGSYFLVCNVIDPDTGDIHFSHKMYVPFTVK